MYFSVAGLRRAALTCLAGLALTSPVVAHDDVLFTSSVSYCSPPQLILVQQFDIRYFAANASLFFNVSAASVEDNVNVTANLALNIYGLPSINITLDLCSLLNGALCPLPTYNFVGSETIRLSDLGVASDITDNLPGIAYKIPDLEAFAQLTLLSVDTGEVKACVQSTISNGWSTRQVSVQWATGGLALVALFVALLSTLLPASSSSPSSRFPQRFIDLMLLFQTIAASALLDLNYPVVYRAFATNFAWALGLFSSSSSSSIQNSIDNMRHKTGGSLSDADGGDGVDLVNRKLSPYNVASVISVNAETRTAIKSLQAKIAAKAANVSTASFGLTKRDTTVTVTQENMLDAGIPVYVSSLGISTANAFMTVFLTLLMLIAIAGAVLGLSWVGLWALRRRRERKGLEVREWKEGYFEFAKAWALRLTLVVMLPVLIFALHQWTLKDSWLSTLFSVLTFLAILGTIAYSTFLAFRIARQNRSRPETLYEDDRQRTFLGVLYGSYKPQRWFFFALPLAVLLIKALVIAFGSASGLAQLIVIVLFELILLVSTLTFRPHPTRGSDVLASTLAIARLLITCLAFAFVERFNIAAIPRVAIGLVAAVIASLCVVLMFFNLIVNLGLRSLWRERVRGRLGSMRLGSSTRLGSGSRTLSVDDASAKGSDSMLEKQGSEELGAQYATHSPAESTDRPRNPTPHQHEPLDPALNTPYPAVTPPTTASSQSHNKMYARNSDYRVSYASSQMPSTGTTFDSFATGESGGSGASEETFGRELPRRNEFEGLGLERLDVDSWMPSPALPRMSEGSEEEERRT